MEDEKKWHADQNQLSDLEALRRLEAVAEQSQVKLFEKYFQRALEGG